MSAFQKIEKSIPLFCNGVHVLNFEELYFHPIELKNIFNAINIFFEIKIMPVIAIHVNGDFNCSILSNDIGEILRYNRALGYNDALIVEFKVYSKNINKMTDISRLSRIANVKILVVTEYYQNNIELLINEIHNIDFLRINFKDTIWLCGNNILLPDSLCSKLARCYLSNSVNYELVYEKAKKAGFDGMQIVKRVDTENLDNGTTHLTIQNQIKKILEIRNSQFKVFVDGDISKIGQKRFKIPDEHHGICMSSILKLSYISGTYYVCPYNTKCQKYQNILECLKGRCLINSHDYGCNDCGYISDNILYRLFYAALCDGYNRIEFDY